MKAVKFVCMILSSMLIFCMSVNVYADEEDYEETDNNEEYYYEEYEDEYNDEYEEYDYKESEEYIEESYEEYYEEETVSEISEEVSEEISQEVVTEVSEEISETVIEEVSPVAESSIEKSEVSKPAVQRVVNIADEAKKEDNTANEISGNVMWGIIFILLIFCIIFLPRTRGMEFVKDRYRYRKAKNITRRHIR